MAAEWKHQSDHAPFFTSVGSDSSPPIASRADSDFASDPSPSRRRLARAGAPPTLVSVLLVAVGAPPTLAIVRQAALSPVQARPDALPYPAAMPVTGW